MDFLTVPQKPNPTMTPRNKLNSINSQASGILDCSRRSTTPSRIHDRVSNSPLKLPLTRAINKVARDRSPVAKSPSRRVDRSSRYEENSRISVGRRVFC